LSAGDKPEISDIKSFLTLLFISPYGFLCLHMLAVSNWLL